MIYLAVALFMIGALLLTAEIFIPGFGVCGISGLVALAASAVLTVLFAPYGIFIMVLELLFVAAAAWGLIRFLRKRNANSSLILKETLNFEAQDVGDLDYFLGKEGMSKTPLRPQGFADFNGVSMEVFSDGSFIPARKKIKVVEVSQKRLIVKLAEGQQ